MAADIVGFDLSSLWHSGGAVHDPLAALVFCQPQAVDFALVNGRLLVVGEAAPNRFAGLGEETQQRGPGVGGAGESLNAIPPSCLRAFL